MIAESVIQVAAHVVGNDATVALAGAGGYFELNTMMPVAAYNLLQSVALLAASARNFADQCVVGITATETGPAMVEKGLMLGTALAPSIGYDAAAGIAKKAAETGQTIRDVARLDNLPDRGRAGRVAESGRDDQTQPGSAGAEADRLLEGV